MGFIKDRYKVRIEHHRIPDIPPTSEMSKTKWEQTFTGAKVKKNGGITKVLLCHKTHGTSPAVGSSNCIHGDNYDKEKGRSIAAGRLLRAVHDSIRDDNALIDVVQLLKETKASFDTDLVWKAFMGEKIN